MDQLNGEERKTIGKDPGDEPFRLTGGPGRPRGWKERTGLDLTRDFATGCFTLFVGMVLVFLVSVFAGILVVAYKVTVWLAVPVAALVALVLLTTLLGRIVNLLHDRFIKPKRDGMR